MSTSIGCRQCGSPAAHYIVMDNVPHANRTPLCAGCTQAHEATAQEVNEHEMHHFGGAYGLVTFHYEPLEPLAKSDVEYWTRSRTAILDAIARAGFELMSDSKGFWLHQRDAKPAAWVVVTDEGPDFVAHDRQTCHEHINSAINDFAIEGAEEWIVRPVYLHPHHDR